MTDQAFARAFEAGSVIPVEFGHLAHVRVAWVYLHESACVEEALSAMRAAIQRFASAAGVPQKYHETITVFWMRLLANVRALGAAGELADVVRQYPALGDKDLPLRYYSRERLFSDEARTSWVDPDRRPHGVIAFQDTEA
ncbi:MAG: hypothetical protein ABIQ52_03330 [Vicinamibacterales bacterium]